MPRTLNVNHNEIRQTARRLEIAGDDLSAVAGAQLREGRLLNRYANGRWPRRTIDAVGNEPGRPVPEGPVGAGRVPAPEANLGTVVLDGARLESHGGRRAAGAVDAGDVAGGDILSIEPFASAHHDVANAAAVETGAGEPPAGSQVNTGRPLADHQRVARPVGDRGKVDLCLLSQTTVGQDAAKVGGLRNRAARIRIGVVRINGGPKPKIALKSPTLPRRGTP